MDAAEKAETLLEAGNHAKAMAALRGASELIWNAAPLTINKAILVASDPKVLAFTISRRQPVPRGDDIVIYTEPSAMLMGGMAISM